MSVWIDRLVREKYGTYGALAKRIGMTDSGFTRAAKAGTFDVENCLKLAEETGEPAGSVLEMAGKPHVNALIEKLYGKARPSRDPDVVKAAEMIGRIRDDQAREGFLMMMRGYLKQQAASEAAPATPRERHR